MIKQIFVNLPIKNLDKSMAFFKKLGFTFNPQFTDKNNGCMILGENMFAMLLMEDFFKTFIKKEIADSVKTTEVINAIAVNTKEEVDIMLQKAVEAGGNEPRETIDYGWMYNRAFEDLDGHIWEVFSMDEKSIPKKP